MSSWRDAILNDFVPNVSKLTLVADPDCLLTEEKLALELRERGFDLIEFNDPVEFRYAYESKYRSSWDRGEHPDLVVVLRSQDAELESLPYDLLQAGRTGAVRHIAAGAHRFGDPGRGTRHGRLYLTAEGYRAGGAARSTPVPTGPLRCRGS